MQRVCLQREGRDRKQKKTPRRVRVSTKKAPESIRTRGPTPQKKVIRLTSKLQNKINLIFNRHYPSIRNKVHIAIHKIVGREWTSEKFKQLDMNFFTNQAFNAFRPYYQPLGSRTTLVYNDEVLTYLGLVLLNRLSEDTESELLKNRAEEILARI